MVIFHVSLSKGDVSTQARFASYPGASFSTRDFGEAQGVMGKPFL